MISTLHIGDAVISNFHGVRTKARVLAYDAHNDRVVVISDEGATGTFASSDLVKPESISPVDQDAMIFAVQLYKYEHSEEELAMAIWRGLINGSRETKPGSLEEVIVKWIFDRTRKETGH